MDDRPAPSETDPTTPDPARTDGAGGEAAAGADASGDPAWGLGVQVLAGLPEAVALLDREGRYRFVNAAAVPSPERRRWLIGRTPLESAEHWGDDGEVARRFMAFARVAVQERRPLQYEETLRRRSGRVQHFLCTLTPITDADGAVTHVAAYGDDRTAHRRAETALVASRRRLALYREQAPLGFIEWSLDFRVRDWNPAAERIFGYAKEEALGRRPEELVGGIGLQGRERAVWRALLRHRGGYRATQAQTTKDGRAVVCEWLNTPVLDAEGHVVAVVSIVQDVTEREERARQLVAAKEAAEAAAQLKSTILNNLTHEIRTPLTAILGFAEVLTDEAQGEPQRQFAELISQSGRRLMGTLNAVLDLARLESGQAGFRLGPIDLHAAAEEAVAVFRRQAEQKGLALELAPTSRAASAMAHLDSDGTYRILSNLLSNAIKFTDRGGVRVEVGREGADVYLRVADTGAGIGEAFLPELFEEFRQESAGLARQHEGSGLGLAITKRLVEGMGGAIEVASVEGEGATFTVRFPAYPDQARRPAATGTDVRGG